ncbi:M-phase phosphoprotein 8 isoform X2 [Conger conger]|uniref:M-phase phosphoprotein 8 isoform X2 n=1 Tax=Conger conger TaxID=82655 RepID=UPI002A59935D|nr:M-phase phosphoprotein 8 isoform X2 [Conger conger]
MGEAANGAERFEPGDSEQDEEDVYEVESIIDMRMGEGEILYRVRWKNYTAEEDTWEPEANLEDCMEVLLAFRKKVTESKAMKEVPAKLPMKSDLFNADSESDSDKPEVSSPRKKKKKNLVEDLSPEMDTKKKKQKKEKKKWKQEKVLPGPESDRSETDDEDSAPAPAPPCAPNATEPKQTCGSDDGEEAIVTPKKRKKETSKDTGKHRRAEAKDAKKPKKEGREGKKRKENCKMLDSSEEEDQSATAEGELSEASEPQTAKAAQPAGKPHSVQGEEPMTMKAKQKQSKPGLKLQGIRDLIHEKKSKKPLAQPTEKENAHQKLKNLMNLKSQRPPRSVGEDEPSRLSSDSSEVAAVISVKKKSKVLEAASQGASSSPSSSSCSSSSAAVATMEEEAKLQSRSASGPKGKSSSMAKLEDSAEKDLPPSTNLFEKFLLNCEAKDRVSRRQSTHPTTLENRAEQAKPITPKTTGKAEKKAKTLKESLAQKLAPDKMEKAKKDTKMPGAPGPAKNPAVLEVEEKQGKSEKSDGQGTKREKSDRQLERKEHTDSPEKQTTEEATESRELGVAWEKTGEVQERKERVEELRERRERTQDAWGCRFEKKKAVTTMVTEGASPESADEAAAPGRVKERRRRREDSEPRLYIACEDNQDSLDLLEHTDRTKELTPAGLGHTHRTKELTPAGLGHTDRTKELTPADKGQTSLNIGVDLKLDWMTLEDFQKHLNGDDEIRSAIGLSPSELRDAVKGGDYLAVKLALGSKDDYNLDQEDSSGMSLTMLAAAGGRDDMLRLLIRKGVRVNGRQKNGTTALMHAAEKNFLSTVAILLEAGAYINAQTLVGETALMKACKRGNADVVRLLLEQGADCNILSKHQNNALNFAKLSNNMIVYDHVKDHMTLLSSVAEETIRAYFETRLALLEPVFPLACHRLCEGPDFSLEFSYKPPPHSPVEGSGILLFVFHANFLSEITARLCGPCSVHAVVLNDKFQLPIFLDSHFIYSFSPVPGTNKLFIRLAESPTAKVKLLICAYRVQVQ